MYYKCVFPASCFRQRTNVAQGLVNGILNETRTHPCFQFEWNLVGQVGLHRAYSPSFLECVYFSLLYPSLIFDMFIVECESARTRVRVCVCVCVCVCLSVCELAFEQFWVSPLTKAGRWKHTYILYKRM